jgi:hypothetical protein
VIRHLRAARRRGLAPGARPLHLGYFPVLACGLLLVGLVYFAILSPRNIAFDAYFYHLGLAQQYATEGAIRGAPEGWVPATIPHLASILYTWCFTLPGMSLEEKILCAAHLEFAPSFSRCQYPLKAGCAPRFRAHEHELGRDALFRDPPLRPAHSRRRSLPSAIPSGFSPRLKAAEIRPIPRHAMAGRSDKYRRCTALPPALIGRGGCARPAIRRWLMNSRGRCAPGRWPAAAASSGPDPDVGALAQELDMVRRSALSYLGVPSGRWALDQEAVSRLECLSAQRLTPKGTFWKPSHAVRSCRSFQPRLNKFHGRSRLCLFAGARCLPPQASVQSRPPFISTGRCTRQVPSVSCAVDGGGCRCGGSCLQARGSRPVNVRAEARRSLADLETGLILSVTR